MHYLELTKTHSCYLLQNSADALGGGIFVVLGVPGQQLQDPLAAVRQPSKHVREGATAVDGEVKLPCSLSHDEDGEKPSSFVNDWSEKLRDRGHK